MKARHHLTCQALLAASIIVSATTFAQSQEQPSRGKRELVSTDVWAPSPAVR